MVKMLKVRPNSGEKVGKPDWMRTRIEGVATVVRIEDKRGEGGIEKDALAILDDGTWAFWWNLCEIPEKKSTGNWLCERNSGFSTYRCMNCDVWVYANQPRKCACGN